MGKVVGASSWQVVSRLNHSVFISAHLYCSGFALFVFAVSARLRTISVVWSASLPPTPHSSPHGTAVLRVLMVCCLRTVGASTACSSGPWESNREPRFGRPLECNRLCTVTHLSLACLRQSERLPTLHTSMTLIFTYIHNTSMGRILLYVN
jgi:hypothetical protein